MRVLFKPQQRRAIGNLERFRQPALRLISPGTSDDLLAVDSLGPVDAHSAPNYVWIARRSLQPEQCRRLVFYVHGGGFAKGDLAAFQHSCAALSTELNALLAFPLYGLCPEQTLEQAVEQLGQAYRHARNQLPALPLVIVADSAGGLLAILLLKLLQQSQTQLPHSLVLFSPLLDLSLPASSFAEYADRDPLLDIRLLNWACSLALQNADPEFATVNWQALGHFPRTYIVACSDELLYVDSRRLESALASHCVSVTADSWTGLCHAFPLLHDYLPEAREVIARVGEWLDEHEGPTSAPRGSAPESV